MTDNPSDKPTDGKALMSLSEMSRLSSTKITEERAAALGLHIIHREKLGRYMTTFVDRAQAMLKVEELQRTTPRDFSPAGSRVLMVEVRDTMLLVAQQQREILERLTAIEQTLGAK